MVTMATQEWAFEKLYPHSSFAHGGIPILDRAGPGKRRDRNLKHARRHPTRRKKD